jgi:hypothetical protein
MKHQADPICFFQSSLNELPETAEAKLEKSRSLTLQAPKV